MTEARIVFCKAAKQMGLQALGTVHGGLYVEVTKLMRDLKEHAGLDEDRAIRAVGSMFVSAMREAAGYLGFDIPGVTMDRPTQTQYLMLLSEPEAVSASLKPMTRADWDGMAGAEPSPNEGIPPHICYVDDEMVVTADAVGVFVYFYREDDDESYMLETPNIFVAIAVAENLTRANFKLYGLTEV